MKLSQEQEYQSIKIKELKNLCWQWLSNNWYEIAYVEVPIKLHSKVGVFGDTVRRSGKPMYNTKFSHEFIEWLDTPDAIRVGRRLVNELLEYDGKVYRYAELKANGKTLAEMEILCPELGSLRRVKRNTKRGSKSYEYSSREKVAKIENTILCRFLTLMPRELVEQFGMKETIDLIVQKGFTKGFKVREEELKLETI